MRAMDCKWIFCVLCLFCGFLLVEGSEIVVVLDKHVNDQNPRLLQLLTPEVSSDANVSVIIHTDNSRATFLKVCEEVQNGAYILLDISSPDVGPLLRSFAREHGLVLMTMIDESLVMPVDYDDEFYIQIQPPGAAMLKVVSDVVSFDNLTNIAILYDTTFNLHQIPRRIVSGVLSHHIYQEIEISKMSEIMGGIKRLEIESVFIIADARQVESVLNAASGELYNEEINWFVLTKDAKIECLQCKHRMRVVVADGVPGDRTQEYVNYMRTFFPNFMAVQMKIDEAFTYDLMRIFRGNVPQSQPPMNMTNCYEDKTISNETLMMSSDIVRTFSQVRHEGVYGAIISEARNIRQKIKMNLKSLVFQNGQEISKKQLGHWTEKDGFNITEDSLIREKTKKIYKVVVIASYEPFVYRDEIISDNGTKTFEYRGLCIDLFKEVARALNFDYEMYEVEDGYFGSLKEDGTWNGAIDELIQKRADIAVGPISVMSEREKVVDFTVPFHEPVGLTILMKKQKFEYILHKFLKVLDVQVWMCIVASFFLFSVLMWLFDKFSPFSYQNNPDSGNGPEKRIFTLKEGIWFCMTSLTPQGGGEAPKAISGRLVAATWWLYGFLLIAFYTANLAATLTVTRLETPIESLDDLSKQQSVRYGPVNGTAALVYFTRMKQIETQFYQIWKDMSLNESLSPVARAKLAVWDYPVSEQFTKLMSRMTIPNTQEEAIEMVKRGEFALIEDASRNKYKVLTDCDVEVIGDEFSRKPFAFAVVQGSPIRTQISNVILELASNRKLEDFTNKWWDSNENHVDCPRLEDESDGISIKNIGGVFLVIAIGTALSLISFVCEYYYYKIRPKQNSQAYKLGEGDNIKRLESGVSLDSVQVRSGTGGNDVDNDASGSRDFDSRYHDYRSNSTDGRSNVNKRKTSSRQNKDSKTTNECNGHLPQGNGHANGIRSSIFTYENLAYNDSRAELFPSMLDDPVQDQFSEKL